MIGYKWYDSSHVGYVCSKCNKLIPYNMSIIDDTDYQCISCYKGVITINVRSFYPFISFSRTFTASSGIRFTTNHISIYSYSKLGNVIDFDNDNDIEYIERLPILREIYRDFLLPKPKLSPKKYDVEFIFDW